MRVPLSWLSEFIQIQHSPDEIAALLTSLGIEVDGIETAVLEISLTPNLGHCASILGVARELAAATNGTIRMPTIKLEQNGTKSATVTVQDVKRCPRYTCRIIEGITIGPSPSWMQGLLTAAGLRPINNVVDITNYVLLELGQPLHAFDYEQIEGGTIVVRDAKPGERFTTLDGKERSLSNQDLLICDAKKPIALAGVMGGQNTEVTDKTKTILLESAYFDARTIRLTSQRLGLQTDASKHFDRGIDANAVVTALDRAAMLIQEHAGGRVGPLVDKKAETFDTKSVTCRLSQVNRILGTSLSMSEVQSTFARLGMPARWDGLNAFTVTVPTYRNDVASEIDLIEEVARLYGYNNLFKGQSAFKASTIPDSPLYLLEKEVRACFRAQGLQEFITCDLIGPQSLKLQLGEMDKNAVIQMRNSTAEELSILRTSLLPGFLELVKYNQDHQVFNIRGFEVGRVYFKREKQYVEQPVAGIVLTGKNRAEQWDQTSGDVDFFDLKGSLESLLDQLGISEYTFTKSAFATLHTGRQASLFLDQVEIATLGEVHPSLLRQLGIKQRVLFAEINLVSLMQKRGAVRKMKPLALYPCSERDWTLTLQEQVPIGHVLATLESHASPLLEEAKLLYLYRSDKLGADRKNVTVRLIYRDTAKTISQEVVETEHARIIGETLKTLKL